MEKIRHLFCVGRNSVFCVLRRMSIPLIGIIAAIHPALAYETIIADAKTRAVVEKRKTLIDAVPDEKLKQLFPLPQDKTALIGECLKLEGDIKKRGCIEALAEGYFEGNFKEDGQTVCGLLQGAVWGEQYKERCLCYGTPTPVAIDKCITKVDQKLQALLKEQEKAQLLERLLAPLKVDPKKVYILPQQTEKTTPQEPPSPQVTTPKAVDLNGEIMGEPVSPKEPEVVTPPPDQTAKAILDSFLETVKNKKHYELFTPESYALSLFANIKFLEKEKIAEGLKKAQAQTIDAHTIKLLPADSQGTYNYLVKLGDEWYLDNIRATVEQKTAAGAPPVAELDDFLKQKDLLIPLVQKSIQLCNGLKNNYFEQGKKECPTQLMEWIGPAYQKKPSSAKDLEVVLEYAEGVLNAPDFDAQNFVTEKTIQSMPEGMKTIFKQVQKEPLRFLQELLSDLKEITKKDDNTYLFSDEANVRTYFVRMNSRWLIDIAFTPGRRSANLGLEN